jgi:hypothetical protein
VRRVADLDQVIRHAVALSLGLALAADYATAQSATISGRIVAKGTSAAIAGAEIALTPGSRRLVSDDDGSFRFEQVAPGNVTLFVRHIGFSPESASFAVEARDDLDIVIELNRVAQTLDTVSVSARQNVIPRGKLAGFYERKRVGIGKYIDSDMIAKEPNARLGDLIISLSPGTKLVRARNGFSAWIATTRDTGARPEGIRMDPLDARRGADPLACYPDVYLDGMNVYRFGTGQPLFDINSIASAEAAAIELYVGAARIPAEYNSSSAACGVLLIWTK